ncbi:RING-14 protein-like protein [Massariosphaeria phaeospora]|uniref:RING-14 protein-like protein n=1 Tax=Massariosphaeria phaeospora TaxID=100035 RepID=A0A7C8I4B6_9PLEO|nr:RING-14 protein-like protein [Massariosphaeria phaeospora]
MKFGHAFAQSLSHEGYPQEWVDSAIGYSQLKKCINRLTQELADVGLSPTALSQLLKHVEDFNAAAEQHHDPDPDPDPDRPFQYILARDGSGSSPKEHTRFQPKLLFYVNELTGELHSAKIDEDTKRKLQMLAVDTGLAHLRVFEESDAESKVITSSDTANPANPITPFTPGARRKGYRMVEVPLSSDTEFFTKLATELSGLEALQEREEKRMRSQIELLGKQMTPLTDPDRRANRKIIAVWRHIFQIYLEEGIFFGTTEQDHTAHDAEKARERFQDFCNKIATTGLVDQFKKRDNLAALTAFMNINREILQGLRFGEINHTAMQKILKKFDKQTALGVKTTFPKAIAYPSFSSCLARAVCAEVNTRIVARVPQLDDYSCPMCMEVNWRPVKLRCEHVFCIRCLIIMQTNKQHRCPLCRDLTVVDACSDNLDLELAKFLKRWFPDEVKAKQKYNERMAGVDQYGEVYVEQCAVM